MRKGGGKGGGGCTFPSGAHFLLHRKVRHSLYRIFLSCQSTHVCVQIFGAFQRLAVVLLDVIKDLGFTGR